jgi:small subunit ribosomal protein S29e
MTNLTYTHPRTYGKDSRHCRVCHTTRGLIRKYGLNMCRRCFRERATQIGFVKVGFRAARFPSLDTGGTDVALGFCLVIQYR